jgi:hypothetical protein
MALDARTGAPAWRCQGVKEAQMRGWSSPMVVRRGGRDLVLAQTLHHLLGIDAASGKVLWEWDVFGFDKNGKRPNNALGNAPVLHGDLLYVASAYPGNPGFGFQLAADGASVTEAYRSVAVRPLQESMVRVGNLVFGAGGVSKADCAANPALLVNGQPLAEYLKQRGPKERDPWDSIPRLVCMDLRTGQPLGVALGTEWGLEDCCYGGMMLVYADGRLYGTVSGGPRLMMLYEPTPALTLRGRFELPIDSVTASGKGKGWIYTAPVISGGRLLIRRNADLLCYDASANP